MGYYDFPHTRNYDSDLGFLIKKYNELDNKYDTLIDIYNVIKKQITDITLEQLQKWLDDGTLENIINEQIFGQLNTRVDQLETNVNNTMNDLNNKTNITEYNQNVIQGHCRTYGIFERGCMASFITNDMNQPPQISGIIPGMNAVGYDSRDSVAVYMFGAGVPPLIDQSVSAFTSNSVSLPNLNVDEIVDNTHNLALKDLPFQNTIVDVYVDGSFTYFGFIKSFDPSTKTFTLRDGTGFYKYNSGSTDTYTPPANSQVLIGNITAVWGSNIIACDKVGGKSNNVRNLCGLELMVIKNNIHNGSRNLHLVTGGSQPNDWYILADGSKPTKNAAYMQNLTERGLICRLDNSVSNRGEFWLMGLQDSSGNDIFHIDGNGKQTNLGVNAVGVFPNSGNGDGYLNPHATVFILTDDTPHWMDYADVKIDGKIIILCNHGTSVTHEIAQGLGGQIFQIAPQKTRILIWVNGFWYPVLYTDLK